MSDTHSRTALVTGGAGDIGSAIVRTLARDGWDVVVADLKPQGVGEALCLEISEGSGQRVTYVHADQGDQAAIDAIVSGVPGLELAVITAATVEAQPFLEIDLEKWSRQISINLTGSFVSAQSAARHMARSTTKGHILFVSSWVSSHPWPEISAYSVSKAGVDQLMRQVALELAPLGIRANAIAPGIVKAGLAKHQLETEPAYAARVATAIPLGELQTADDIAGAVSFMASPGAATMTGTVLTIDGGCSLGQVR